MRIHNRFLPATIGLCLLLSALAGYGQQQTVGCIGHSDCRSQYEWIWRDFPGTTWVASGHDSARLNQLLAWEQYDIAFVMMQLGGQCPNWFEVLVGTTDAELQGLPGNRNYTPVTQYIQELQQYLANIAAACPGSRIVLPNVPPFNVMVLQPPASYDSGIAARVQQYNQYESYQQFQAVSVDVWTPLQLNGWATPWMVPYIDPNGQGWYVADKAIAAAMGLKQ